MPALLGGKRSRLITIAAAGTIAVGAVISAAVVLPPGSAASMAGAANAHLLVINEQRSPVGKSDTMTAAEQLIQSDQLRYVLKQHQTESRLAAAAKKAAAAKAAAAKKAAAKAAAAQQGAPQPAQQVAVTEPSGSPEQIALQMLSQFGWSSSQFSCLEPLWAHESGWSVTASNPSSGAYGIPQALPGSKMASAGADWETDAATQIRWGLEYIQGTYGSPCGAWAHEEADGWY